MTAPSARGVAAAREGLRRALRGYRARSGRLCGIWRAFSLVSPVFPSPCGRFPRFLRTVIWYYFSIGPTGFKPGRIGKSGDQRRADQHTGGPAENRAEPDGFQMKSCG